MGYEEASTFLLTARPTNLVFAADAPGSKAVEEQSLAKTGVYFLERSGLNVTTVNIILDPVRDPHRQLLEKVRGKRPAILWFYVAEGSAAARFPPVTSRIGRGWKCLHQKHRTAGVMACAPGRLFG